MNATQISDQLLNDLLPTLSTWISEYGLRFIVALVIFYLGIKISKKISNVFKKLLNKKDVEQTLISFLGNIVYYALFAAVVIMAIGQLGISITSFIAVLGAAGLAIGLALKDSLGNFAAGVMLILLRFFKIGDYVELAGTSGTVEAVNIFNTQLLTPDNQRIFVPNSHIISGNITNVTANPTRRLDLTIGISYEDDIAKAKKVIADILSAEKRILPDPAPVIVLGELADSSVNLYVRPWVKTGDLWSVRWDLLEAVKKEFDRQGISIPFPQQEVHVKSIPAT
jgi:small conductance mechanosensitive channel